MLTTGRGLGAPARRVPAEPPGPRAALEPGRGRMAALGGRLLAPWVAGLRRRIRRAGLAANDQLFGLAWTGAMTEPRMLGLIDRLPGGVSEFYCHPAVAPTPELS